MSHRRAVLSAGVIVVGWAVAAAAGPAVAADGPANPKRIVCFGDSITEGVHIDGKWRRGQGWVRELEALGGGRIKTICIGLGGCRTSGKEWLMGRGKSIEDVDRVILFIGVNDSPLANRGSERNVIEKAAENVAWMARRSREMYGPDVKVTILSSPGLGVGHVDERFDRLGYNEKAQAMLDKLRAEYRKTAEADGCDFLDLWGVVSKENYQDGVHPTLAGHRQIARAVWDHLVSLEAAAAKGAGAVLGEQQAAACQRYVEQFNQADAGRDPEDAAFPDARAWDFIRANCPQFDCPDKRFEMVYYYRWWVYRKHVRKRAGKYVVSEFVRREPTGGPVGQQICEGRWLRDRKVLDDDVAYWLAAGQAGPLADACYGRTLATGDKDWAVGVLPDLVKGLQAWEKGLRVEGDLCSRPDSGGPEPALNACLYGEATAIARLARLAGREDLAREWQARAGRIKAAVQQRLWDKQAGFFKSARREGDRLVLAATREAAGFAPWYFNLPDRGYEVAWKQLTDPEGFFAPYGPTTVERRDPAFLARPAAAPLDGSSWPFATTRTLAAMANLLNDDAQENVTGNDYFKLLKIYVESHYSHLANGAPMVGQWVQPATGKWHVRPWPGEDCSEHCNGSGFCDLVVTGLAGIRPQADPAALVVNPLLPQGAWDSFCLAGVPYHGRSLTVLWDKDGSQYQRGKGLRVFCDGREIGQRPDLGRLDLTLPPVQD